MIRAVRVAGCGVALAIALAACKQDEGGAASLGPVNVDTSNAAPMDGVSDEQLKAEAQALTPEEAAARGVAVDTTIHVENLGQDDSTAAAPRDTAPSVAPSATRTAPTAPAAKP